MQDLPESIGGYRVLRELGRGGMGIVYLAHQDSLDRQLAIKLMAPQLTRTPEFAQRFLREGKIAASLRHPNIVQIYNAASDGDHQFLVMEYVQGSNLQQLLEGKTILPEKQALSLVIPLLEALHHAHLKGIVHRDVKPANVLLAEDGRVVLTDFSVALLQEGARITSTGIALGTPAYMAPEQFSNATLDGRTDVYAVGVILYELVTGFNPFVADSVAEVLKRQLLEDPPRPRSLTPELSPDVEALIQKAICKDPDDRFAFALEMAEEARRCLAMLEARPGEMARRAGDTAVRQLALRAVSPVPSQPPRPGLWTRRCWFLLALLATLGMLAYQSLSWGAEDAQARRALVLLETNLRRVELVQDSGSREVWQAREYRDFEPGTYRLRFESRGYRPQTFTVQARPYQVVRLAVQLQLRQGRVKVSSALSDVALTADGQPVGSLGHTPMTLELTPGMHEIGASKTDYLPWTARVQVQEDQEVSCKVTLQPIPATLQLSSQPKGARLLVNGKALGNTPLELQLPPGRSTLELHLPKHLPWKETLQLRAGQSWSRKIELQRRPEPAPVRPAPPPVWRPEPAVQTPPPARPSRPSSPGGWDLI